MYCNDWDYYALKGESWSQIVSDDVVVVGVIIDFNIIITFSIIIIYLYLSWLSTIYRCRKCPFPFEIRRNDLAECTCECFSDDINCLRIKRGHKALSERELAWVKVCRHQLWQIRMGISFLEVGFCIARSLQEIASFINSSRYFDNVNPYSRLTFLTILLSENLQAGQATVEIYKMENNIVRIINSGPMIW